jgi:hypothetical protein
VSKRSAKNDVAEHRERQAYLLRCKGWPFRKIGAELGMVASAARGAFERAHAKELARFEAAVASHREQLIFQLIQICNTLYDAFCHHRHRPDYALVYLKASGQLAMWLRLRSDGHRENLVSIDDLKRELMECNDRGILGHETEKHIRELEFQVADVTKMARKRRRRENVVPSKKKKIGCPKEEDEQLMSECELVIREALASRPGPDTVSEIAKQGDQEEHSGPREQ